MSRKVPQAHWYVRIGCATCMNEHHKHVGTRLGRQRLAITGICEKIGQIVTALRRIFGFDLAKTVTCELEQVLRVTSLAFSESAKILTVIEQFSNFCPEPTSSIRV